MSEYNFCHVKGLIYQSVAMPGKEQLCVEPFVMGKWGKHSDRDM